MFRHMCGKSAKRRGAMCRLYSLQDMSTAKRALVHRAYCMKGANLPRQAYTQMMTAAGMTRRCQSCDLQPTKGLGTIGKFARANYSGSGCGVCSIKGFGMQ